MFTGIVEELGKVTKVYPTRLVVQAGETLEGVRIGDSIAINGACLTVVELENGTFSVDVTPETLRRTNLGALEIGHSVNLERSLAMGDRLGGHMVQGHIEATGTILHITPDGDSIIVECEAPPEIIRYLVAKGFIAIDGTSLTVVECNISSFTISVIPYTRQNTLLGTYGVGNRVNLETDIVARYVERLVTGNNQ